MRILVVEAIQQTKKRTREKKILKNFFALQSAPRGFIASRFILCNSSDAGYGIAVFWLLCRHVTSVQPNCFAQPDNEDDL